MFFIKTYVFYQSIGFKIYVLYILKYVLYIFKIFYQGAGKLPRQWSEPEGEDHCPEGPKGPRVGQKCEPEGP